MPFRVCFEMYGQEKATVNMDSAYTDPELHEWLVWAEEHGSNFMRALAEAAMVADIKHFNLLRPVLLKLKKEES